MATGSQTVMTGKIKMNNGAMSGNMVGEDFNSRSPPRKSRGETVRLLLAQQLGKSSVFQISWGPGRSRLPLERR